MLEIYRARWQIELCFKRMKSLLQVQRHALNAERVAMNSRHRLRRNALRDWALTGVGVSVGTALRPMGRPLHATW